MHNFSGQHYPKWLAYVLNSPKFLHFVCFSRSPSSHQSTCFPQPWGDSVHARYQEDRPTETVIHEAEQPETFTWICPTYEIHNESTVDVAPTK